jgi:hydrogenase maturation protease
MTGSCVVIGVGNPSRRDDGVGWVVAEAAGRRFGEIVEVRQCDGESARLLDAWADVAFALVIDAMHSGAPPGTIRVMDAEELPVPAPSGSLGSHAIGIVQAATLGRILDQLPQRLVVVGIEARETGWGEGLSPPVTAAVGPAVDLVGRLVEADLSAIASTHESAAARGSAGRWTLASATVSVQAVR